MSRTYSDLVVEESHTYDRDLAGFAQTRTITVKWAREDDALSDTVKVLTKTYSLTDSIREGKRSRKNVIDGLEIQVAGMLMLTEVAVPPTDPGYAAEVQAALDLGRAFLTAHQPEITAFVEGSIRTLHTTSVPNYSAASIQNAPADWMDNSLGPVTVRDVILSTLDIWS
jgi:hypothetical protein